MRPLLLALALPVALVLNACGSSDDTVAATPSTVAGIEHPTGADEVVLQVDVSGGFVPAEVAFGSLPQLTIYGDGTVIRPGAVPAIFPGPMVFPLFETQLSEEGLQQVLEAAEAAGLLQAPPDYDSPGAQQVADAPTTTVLIDAAGGPWVHKAYGLAEATLDTPARRALSDFVTMMSSLETLVGADALGPEEPYEPTELRIRATPNPQPQDVEATIVAWPDSDVRLADAAECAVVGGATVEALQGANQLTWFTQDGVTYSLAARPLLPGETGCP